MEEVVKRMVEKLKCKYCGFESTKASEVLDHLKKCHGDEYE